VDPASYHASSVLLTTAAATLLATANQIIYYNTVARVYTFTSYFCL